MLNCHDANKINCVITSGENRLFEKIALHDFKMDSVAALLPANRSPPPIVDQPMDVYSRSSASDDL